jgi:hypothetical protein
MGIFFTLSLRKVFGDKISQTQPEAMAIQLESS